MKQERTESRWAKMKRWADEHEAGRDGRDGRANFAQELAQQQAEAKQRRKTEQEAQEHLGNIVLAVLLSIVVMAMVAMYFAERFPAVWRSSMWMNTPGIINWPSLFAALAVTAAFARALKRRFKPLQGFAFVLPFLVVLPALLLFVHLGLILNGVLDAGPARIFRVPVVAKRWTKGNSKSRPEWFLRVRDWKSAQGLVDIQVSEARHDLTPIGEQIEVETKPGLFGAEWMVRHS